MKEPLFSFEEYEPREALKPYISRWVSLHFNRTEDYLHKIAPSGRIIMTHTHGEHLYAYTECGTEIKYENKTYFKGHRLKYPLRVKHQKGVKEFACEFTYTGFHQLFGIDASKLVDIEYEISHFGYQELNDALFNVSSIPDKITIAEEYFESLISNPVPLDGDIEDLIRKIENGCYDALDLTLSHTRAEKKNLYRKFKKYTGLSIKQFKRIHQMNTAVKFMNNGDYQSLTELGLKAGYYDQADFIKHIKHFLGDNPKEIIKKENDILFEYMGGPNNN